MNYILKHEARRKTSNCMQRTLLASNKSPRVAVSTPAPTIAMEKRLTGRYIVSKLTIPFLSTLLLGDRNILSKRSLPLPPEYNRALLKMVIIQLLSSEANTVTKLEEVINEAITVKKLEDVIIRCKRIVGVY